MSEIRDTWRKPRQECQQQRAQNRANADLLLTEAGIQFEIKNNGAYFIVRPEMGPVIDFWPSTGRWIPRDKTRNDYYPEGRGVFKLLTYIEKFKEAEPNHIEKFKEAEPNHIADYNEIPLPEEP